MDTLRSKHSLSILLHHAGVSKSGYYKWLRRTPSSSDSHLLSYIRAIHSIRPYYGYRRMTVALYREGFQVNHKRVYRLMKAEKIQAVIDKASQDGGGVVYIPKGTFLSGSLFFKPNTHLYIEKGGTLKGSDDISHFAVIDTRMEGQNLKYFAALVNAIGVDGFTISGEGRINGNGLRYWKSFWLRRQVNPKCTNLEELRPPLVNIAALIVFHQTLSQTPSSA